MDAVGAIYERRQDDYHAFRRDVLRRLVVCEARHHTLEDLDATLGPHVAHSPPTPAERRAVRADFTAFLAEGRRLQEHLADALSDVLRQLLNEPVIGAL